VETKRKKTSRDERAEESRERIYETSIDLFARKGFDETSVTAICREAGCSVGAFYHHFASKDAVIEENFRRVDRDAVGWGPLDPSAIRDRDAVLAYMDSYARLVTSRGLEFSKRFYTWKNKNFIKKGRSMQVNLAMLIRGAIDAGNLKLTLPPDEACEWLFVCARGVVFHWCLHEGGFDLAAEMRKAVDRALRGIEA